MSILGGQRMLLGVLLHHLPPYSLKTGRPLNLSLVVILLSPNLSSNNTVV